MDNLDVLFQDVATQISGRHTIMSTRCNDQYVGRIGEFADDNGVAKSRFPCRQDAAKRPRDIPCVVMILESPHRDEFNGVGAVGPANGSTGRNIRNRQFWRKVFGNKGETGDEIKYSEFGLILINSVQYQCSLGDDPLDVKVRNAVFGEMWESELVRESFVSRLVNCLNQRDVVVNCCTSGKARPPLRNRVQDVIQCAIEDGRFSNSPTVLRRAHPSSWASKYSKAQDWPYTGPCARK